MLVPLLVLNAALSGPGVGTGQRELPAIPLVDYTGTAARALDDYLGEVVLLDFFAHWCAPCARLVPHLNELADAYGVHGFHVLGVTGDDQPTAVEWLAKQGAHYAHARDAELALEVELGFHPLPFAVLVDSCGVIVWQGNPAELDPATIEGALDDALALPAWRWPEAAKPVHTALRGGRFAEAHRLAQGVPERGAELAKFVERYVARRGELLEAALAAEDWLGAEGLASELEFGLDERFSAGATRARALSTRVLLSADERARTLLPYQRQLAELWKGVGAVRSAKQADELAQKIRTLGDAHPGTQIERTAKAELETLAALKTVLP